MTRWLCIFLGGCSLLGVTGPPSPPTGSPIQCTDSHGGTVIDVAFGLAAATTAIAVLAADHSPDDVFVGANQYVAAPLLVVAAAYLISAGLGYQRVESCQEAKSAAPPPPVFCTTSPVATSVCYCAATEAACTTRRDAIIAAGGTMAACVPSPHAGP